MNKIGLIIKREYLTRVRKKSFIIMTIIGPLLMASLFLIPIWILSTADDESRKIKVVDETGQLAQMLRNSESVSFHKDTLPIRIAKEVLDKNEFHGLLYIPLDALNNPRTIVFYSSDQSNINVVNYIEQNLEDRIKELKYAAKGIDETLIEVIRKSSKVRIQTLKLTDQGEEKTNVAITTAVGFISAFLIYIFIFIYGVQVMRGVIEEKTSRILEVIISSVRPFQLMMGKIIGIALVGLTQFLLWVVLTFAITSLVTPILFGSQSKWDQVKSQMENVENASGQSASNNTDFDESAVMDMFEVLGSLNIPHIILIFIFYFLGGYLLYSALFAAVGSAVDSETDTQQFMIPITIPLVLAIIVAQTVISNPDSSIAFWFSMIPFTSPVVMMVRLPFGVPAWELYLSMALLIAGFLATTWLAARIYRVGVLMYGKKISYKELGKWLFYRS